MTKQTLKTLRCSRFFAKRITETNGCKPSAIFVKQNPTSEKELFNPFHATSLFLYPLTTSEHLWFSDVFRGIEKNSELKWLKH